MKRRYCAAILLAILFVFVPLGHTTQIIPSTLEYMTDFSDTIVVGSVEGKYSYWEGNKIFTNVEIQVEQFVKQANGAKSTLLELKIPGGTVGDMSFHLDQAPEFSVGEKVMLFLKIGSGAYFPYALSYGVYRIHLDDATGQELIDGPLFENAVHYDLNTMEPVKNREPLGQKEFESFLDQVRQFVEE